MTEESYCMYCGRSNDTTADLTMARVGRVGIQHEEGAPQSNITLLTYRNTLLTHTQAHSQIHRFESLHPSIITLSRVSGGG